MTGFQLKMIKVIMYFLLYLSILPVNLISNRRNAGPVGPTICCSVGAVCG